MARHVLRAGGRGRSGGSPRGPPGRSWPWSCRRAASPAGSSRRSRRSISAGGPAIASPRELHAVGTHIGDEADRLAAEIDALIEPLGDAHGVAGAEAQLARGLLLQGRGGEGRRRDCGATVLRSTLATWNGAPAAILAHGRLGRRLVGEVELVELAAVEMGQAGREDVCRPGGARTARRRSSIPAALKTSISASRSQMRRSATDWTRPAERLPGQLAPEHGREGEADEIVERAGAPDRRRPARG